MLTPRIRAALVMLAASAGLSACTTMGPYGGVGVGVSSGYGGYGGYGYDPYYSGYGYPYGYAGYGSGFGYDPFGWYNGYYYPGSGYWVYAPDHSRRQWTDAEKAYWNDRIRDHVRQKYGLNGTTGTTAATKENWSGFNRPRGVTGDSSATTTTGVTNREAFRQRVLERQQQVRLERQQARSERIEARQQSSSDDNSDSRPSHRRPR